MNSRIPAFDAGSPEHIQRLDNFIKTHSNRFDGKLAGRPLMDALDAAGIPTKRGSRWVDVKTSNISQEVKRVLRETEKETRSQTG